MKNITIIILVLLSYGCAKDSSSNRNDKPTTIKITGDFNNLLQMDSIFESIDIYPLATDTNNLISSIEKILFQGDTVFIQNRMDNLFLFSLKSGKFIREIGKKGRGDNEFYEVRDFDIDSKGNIYILDYQRILMYSNKSKLLDKYNLKFLTDDKLICNPIQFAICNHNSFYLWGGTIGIKNNLENNLYLMYKINKSGNIQQSFFPIKYGIIHAQNRFSKSNGYYNLQPWLGVNTIYKIENTRLSINYIIDFEEKNMDIDLTGNFGNLIKLKKEIREKYANSISSFLETDNWIYFRFNYKKSVYVYYSKILKKAFISMPSKDKKFIIYAYMSVKSTFKNEFYAVIEPRILIENYSYMDTTSFLSQDFKHKLEAKINNIKVTDNPVLLKLKLRNYEKK